VLCHPTTPSCYCISVVWHVFRLKLDRKIKFFHNMQRRVKSIQDFLPLRRSCSPRSVPQTSGRITILYKYTLDIIHNISFLYSFLVALSFLAYSWRLLFIQILLKALRNFSQFYYFHTYCYLYSWNMLLCGVYSGSIQSFQLAYVTYSYMYISKCSVEFLLFPIDSSFHLWA
jgi:hypothetical protein